MAFEKTTISVLTIIFASFGFILNGSGEIFCPKTVTVEEGGTAVVSCDTTGKTIILAYWYTGNPATTIPILRLENGIPGGTEYGRGHYNITSDGAMLIENATIIHEALYTTLMYFQDETDVSKHIMVKVTILPSSLCPVINVCKSCGDCNFSANDTGKLTCSISEVRPVMPLKWIIKSQNGISIVEHPPSITEGVTSNTWNSSAEISFSFSSCNQEAILQCVSQDILNLLQQPESSVRIYTANCTEDKPISTSSVTVSAIVTLLVSLVVISTAVLSICTFTGRRRKGCAGKEVQKLILDLKTKYKSVCLLNPSPWSDLIEVADTYISCHCEVSHTKGDMSFSLVTEKLLKSNSINNEGRVLISGRQSYGNSMFTKLFVQQWIQNSNNDFLLLFIKKNELHADKKLIDYFNDKASKCKDSLAKAIESMKCILFIEELASILPKQKGTSKIENHKSPLEEEDVTTDFQDYVHLTIPEIFHRLELSDHTKIQIWVSSCEENTSNGIFSSPHTRVEVSHVEKQQFDEFIRRVCKQCISCNRRNLSGKNTSKETACTTHSAPGATSFFNEKEMKSTKPRTYQQTERQGPKTSTIGFKTLKEEHEELLDHSCKVEDKLFDGVQNCLKQHEIYKEFRHTPVLLSFIVYTVVNNYFFHTGDLNDVKTSTTYELICNVMKHIEDAYSAQHGGKDSSKFSDLCKSLGKLAVGPINKQSNFVEEENPVLNGCLNDLNLALQIGLIERSKKMPCSEMLKSHTGSTSLYVVTFPSNYLLWYFKAIHVARNEQCNARILEKYNVSENHHVLKFIVLLETSSMKHMFGRGFKLDDFIIDYLYKWDNKDKVKTLIKDFYADNVEVTNLSFEDTRHREAFESFCRTCTDLQVSWKSLCVRDTFFFPFLKSLDFQISDEITLCGLDIEEETLFTFLEWLATKDIALRLLDCEVPQKLSEKFKMGIETIPEIKVKTITQREKDDNSISTLDYKTANWKMESSVDE